MLCAFEFYEDEKKKRMKKNKLTFDQQSKSQPFLFNQTFRFQFRFIFLKPFFVSSLFLEINVSISYRWCWGKYHMVWPQTTILQFHNCIIKFILVGMKQIKKCCKRFIWVNFHCSSKKQNWYDYSRRLRSVQFSLQTWYCFNANHMS